MNKQIRKLAEQAGYEKDMFGFGHWDMPECKKFVELIVKATIDEMVAQMWNYEIDDHRLYKLSLHKAIDITKEHFGVEE